jgi:hypothetical protein
MTTQVHTLAYKVIDGPYGFFGERRLIQRGIKAYLFADEWSGSDLEGRAMRPFVYSVPAALVGECIRVLTTIDAQPDDCNYALLLAKLNPCGRADRLRWAQLLLIDARK